MSLAEEDLHRIHDMVERLVEDKVARLYHARDLELRERMVRVEEELRHQRELMDQGFRLMERRFEQMDKGFEQMDKRFEGMERQIEAVLRRMDRFMFWSLGLTATAVFFIINFLK